MIKLKKAVILIASRKPKTYALRALGCPPDKPPRVLDLAQAYPLLPGRGCRRSSASHVLVPAPGERRHCSLARRLLSMPGAANITVMAARPHPRAFRWGDWHRDDATDSHAVLQHVVIVVAPLARWTRDLRALEDQRGHFGGGGGGGLGGLGGGGFGLVREHATNPAPALQDDASGLHRF
jgi:hypothetical protein